MVGALSLSSATGNIYVAMVEGITDAKMFDSDIAADVMRMAINRGADRARTRAAEQIRKQVNFPASYLSPSEQRLYVSKRASNNDPEARITAQFRATSLARFVKSGTPGNAKAGVTLEVTPGLAVRSKRMFLIRLKRGNVLTDTQFNLGLAIRLKPGETIANKKIEARSMGKGLFLLFGPSVSQVFNTVRDDISPETADFIESEFWRLLEVKS